MEVLPTGFDEPFFWVVKTIVCAFKIIGLAPFSLQHADNSTRKNSCTSVFRFSKIGLGYNILLSVLVLVTGAFAIPQLYSMKYPKKTSITQAIDLVHGTLRISTSCVIILSGAFKQNKAISIMNRLLLIDCLFSGMKKDSKMKKSISFVLIAMQMIFIALLWATMWLSERVFVMSFLNGFILNIPIFIIHWFVIEYSIVLGVLAEEFQNLNENLSNLEEFSDYLFHTSLPNEYNPPALRLQRPRRSQLLAVEKLRKIFTTLTEVSQDVEGFFSFPMLPSVACFSLTLIYNFYYLVIPFVSSISDFTLATDINATAWILVSSYPLILLSFSVTKTSEQAKRTGLLVHKLLARTTRPEVQTELERFSIQLIHTDLTFTAYGFFALDFTLIQSIVGTTATYLVIIIQFMLSTSNSLEAANLS